MSDRLVQVDALTFRHEQAGQDQQTLESVTMQVDRGEVLALTGPSGSGKSTLLTIVGGLRSARHGSVEVLGIQLVNADEKRRVALRRQIGFIFQHHNLASALTVAQNVQLGLEHSGGHRRRGARERIAEAVGRVGLTEHLHKHPGRLSGGQQQRAGIARALVNQPRLVLADEPTASLDWQAGQAVLDLFHQLAAEGGAAVLVTHDKRVLDRVDRVVMLEDGKLVAPAERLLQEMRDSVHTLTDVDPRRLGRMLSFGHAYAQVALADGRVDEAERRAMSQALEAKGLFSPAEVQLVVELALAQARAWQEAGMDDSSRSRLRSALFEMALADNVVTDAERATIEALLRPY